MSGGVSDVEAAEAVLITSALLFHRWLTENDPPVDAGIVDAFHADAARLLALYEPPK